MSTEQIRMELDYQIAQYEEAEGMWAMTYGYKTECCQNMARIYLERAKKAAAEIKYLEWRLAA